MDQKGVTRPGSFSHQERAVESIPKTNHMANVLSGIVGLDRFDPPYWCLFCVKIRVETNLVTIEVDGSHLHGESGERGVIQ